MNKNHNIFKDILFVFPVMFYYALESLIIAIFTTLIGKTILINQLGGLGYFQWAGIIWIAKIILFDVFKVIALSSAGSNMGQEMEAKNSDNTLTHKDFR